MTGRSTATHRSAGGPAARRPASSAWGRIGRAVAGRLTGFGCDISHHNRSPRDGVPYRYADSPLALTASADVLVVAVSGGEHTRGLVSADVLTALMPDGFLSPA